MSKKISTGLALTTVILFGCDKPDALDSQKALSSPTISLKLAAQPDVDAIANSLDVRFELVSNKQKEKCESDITDGNCYEAKLHLTAKEAIDANNWQIFYGQIAPIHNVDQGEFAIEHLNGDLHKITLTSQFRGFKKGETKTITYRAGFWSLSESDLLPNYIIYADGLEPRVIESTRAAIDDDTGLLYLPYVTEYTDYQHQFKRTPADKTKWKLSSDYYQDNTKLGEGLVDVSDVIIPTPKSIIRDQSGATLDLSSGIQVDFGNVDIRDVNVALKRMDKLGLVQKDQGIPITLSVVSNPEKPMGSYQLMISKENISVTGVDGAGVFYGLQSIASLVVPGKLTIPVLAIHDEPLFGFRGLLVDTARNFRSKEFLLSLMEQMAAYKLNKLHLHMGEDEAWRLEIPGLPELTEVGARRCFDLSEQQCLMPQLGAGIDPQSQVNGYYSVEDYQDILRAANERHIQVIPSLDMPGHSRAAIKSMAARFEKYNKAEQHDKARQYLLHDPNDKSRYSSVQFYNDNTINPCQESSFAFVEKVMKEVQKIHADAGQPLTRYHIGADETAGAWTDSEVCQTFLANNDKGITETKQLGAYFVERVANMLSDMGIEPAAWSDGLEHTNKNNMPAVVQANAWDHLPWDAHHKVNELTNRNWQIVVSTPDATYFDFPYEADPKEHGYYWASRHTNTEKVFQFMPENLPIHAEFWLDRQDLPYQVDDTLQHDQHGNIIHKPIEQGRRFYGLQGQLWSENLFNDEMAEYKIFPRVLALAERAWHQANWAVPYNYQGFKYSQQTNVFNQSLKEQRNQQWKVFANALGQKELIKLERDNIFYRLPTVGAKIEDGRLYANIAFPGLAIQYRKGEGDWQSYQGPVNVSNNVFVRAVSYDGQRFSRTVQVK
ncbi:family 20 glycosylhydrolase [Thalassotalea ganghwensis]